MNKKAYNTPKIEVTRIEMQHFIAASITDNGTQGNLSNPLKNGNADEDAMSDINIHDVWE